MFAALCYRVNEYYNASIYSVGTYKKINWNDPQKCELGDEYSIYPWIEQKDSTGLLAIATGLDGKAILRLTETKRYIIKVKSVNKANDQEVEGLPLPSLQNEQNKFLKCEKDKDSITFQFINYLGRSRISFKGGKALVFEVVPDKIDYENDYIELTKALAEHCSELLLDYSGPTSNIYSLTSTDSHSLLEQFIFLRTFCFSDNIQGLFEAIKRNPDRQLIKAEEFKSLGSGMPSQKVFTQPFQYAKNWHTFNSSSGKKYYLPEIVAVTKKINKMDTVANRFLKYALEKFYYICAGLEIALNDNKADKQTECLQEAVQLKYMLDDILHDSFFDDVGQLSVMPQNNQVLQKREGYSQIFRAYSMIDLALQLDWKGEQSVYEGESKNIALLYEYWVFFELGKVIRSINGCEVTKCQQDSFITVDKGKLTIILQEGTRSCQSYVIPSLQMRVNLYYNRTFSPTEFTTTKYEGSYSRPFRPDFTLAIYPDIYEDNKFNGEAAAVKAGAVSYIHFDAKYRISDITAIVGNPSKNSDDEDKELSEEKADAVSNTYKRGDLLKMHTYNDAIRRTIGSYVLYPGDGNDIKQSTFKLYDEILPGVGAFAIKPSLANHGESELRHFITDLIAEKRKNSSRLNRMTYYSEMVLQEPAFETDGERPVIAHKKLDPPNAYYVLGYIRESYWKSLEKNGLLKNGANFLFYYYAIKGNFVYSHHHDIERAKYFRYYTDIEATKEKYCVKPGLFEIESKMLLSKHDLVKKLKDQGFEDEKHYADFYYVIKVRSIDESFEKIDLKKEDVNFVNGNDSFSPHSPKVLKMERR